MAQPPGRSALIDLPAEILDHVIHYLGASFFKSDLRRLSICKAWYPSAREVIRSEVSIQRKSDLEALLQALRADPAASPYPDCVHEKVQRLRVRLNKIAYCNGDDGGETRPSADRHLHAFLRYIIECDEAGEQHPAFALLERFRRLRTLRLEAINIIDTTMDDWGLGPMYANCGCEFAVRSSVRLLGNLALPALRELDLNVVGIGTGPSLLASFQPGAKDPHLCPAINRLLVNLRGLEVVHLTLSCICPAVFNRRPSHGGIALRRLHIDCDIWDWSDDNQALRCGRTLAPVDSPIPTQVVTNGWARDLGAAALDFAGALPSPTLFRVVWPDKCSFYKATRGGQRLSYAWDCLAGRAVKFVRGAPWDSEGTPVDLDEDIRRMRREWDHDEDEVRFDPFD